MVSTLLDLRIIISLGIFATKPVAILTLPFETQGKVTSRFDLAIPVVLQHEGGLVDNPADPGGITKYGISLHYLCHLASRQPKVFSKLFPNNADLPNKNTIKHLTSNQAMCIYRSQWWRKYHYNKIHEQALANKVFDLSVNMGASEANRLLQKAYCKVGDSSIKVDGILGPKTFAYINHLPEEQTKRLLSVYRDMAAEHYCKLVQQRPSEKQFLQGWLHRVYSR